MGWVDDAVSAFGDTAKKKLAGPGEAEAAIRTPIEMLLATAGTHLGLNVVPHDEVHDTDRQVRPDYAISVDGAITGYVEVKKPGSNLDPTAFTGHNRRQWDRQRDLPNLIYTNGTEWRLWRDGESVGDPVHLTGGTLKTAGANLSAPDRFEQLLTEFLRWRPAPITNVTSLVSAIAPLTRLLRGEVLDQLRIERASHRAEHHRTVDQPFTDLAKDWRKLLFPTADDVKFADGYAQTVTFALLLARTENIDLDTAGGLHQVGNQLAAQHSLMSRALQLLTDYVASSFAVTLDLLVRVINAVDWSRIRTGKRDVYLHLYERFLDEYDPDLRKASGSYYTPRQVVEPMTRLVEEVLQTHLNKPTGFADPSVVTVDPALGTGTFLHTIIERVGEQIAIHDGQGAVPGGVTTLATRLFGFELQLGPFAVAELRATDLMADLGASLPSKGLGLYVTDTLDDPYAEQVQLGQGLRLISQSRSRAAKIKATKQVTVVIGNPPYRERAQGAGGWVENGSAGGHRPLDDFRAPRNGRTEYVLKNLYVYFWRWATWKVFESTAYAATGSDTGVVCFISTSGYLRGPGFKGMREYLRRFSSAGWIIDVSPEGIRPDVSTRIFPGVQQPLAIGIFVRKPGTDPNTPGDIKYTSIHGHRDEKFHSLAHLTLSSDVWRSIRAGWQDPLTPAAGGQWDEHPALNNLLPWTSPGVKANRTWVIAPSQGDLQQRWIRLRDERDPVQRTTLFKVSRDSAFDRGKRPLPGLSDVGSDSRVSLSTGMPDSPEIVAYGYRSFNRQRIIADPRVIDQPRPQLWAARRPGQVFIIEQHAQQIADGPGVVFSALIPDMDHFNNRGGRTLPFLHPGGRVNLAAGLVDALSFQYSEPVGPDDVLAYVAAVVAHPAYTKTFADELTTPGIRLPITTDPDLWRRALPLGRTVIWLHTYGAVFADPVNSRPSGDIRLPVGAEGRITNLTPITRTPDEFSYDPTMETLTVGDGTFGPVPPATWDYTVGGVNVLRSWFGYRRKQRGGKKTSPLDGIHDLGWSADWTTELVDLLTVLTRLVALHGDQDRLLGDILAGETASSSHLAQVGVKWPVANDAATKPDYLPVDAVEQEPDQPGFTFEM